jgi:hypothetical protein
MSVERVIVTAHRLGQTTSECDLSAYIDGQSAVAVDQRLSVPYVDLPDGAQRLVIQATPRSPNLWPLRAEFDVSDSDKVTKTAGPDAAQFEVVPSAVSGGRALHHVRVHLGRVRDVTQRSNDILRPSTGVEFRLSPKEINTVDADTPLTGSTLNVTKLEVDPNATESVVLELANVDTPQLIAVHWPSGIAPSAESGPTPFLIYFHPRVGQNAAYYSQGQYPFAKQYLFSGFWAYLDYRHDPLVDVGADKQGPWYKGLPYQISHGGKDVVLVLPLPRLVRDLPPARRQPANEIGVFLDAEEVHQVLLEIQEFFFRRAGIYDKALLGVSRAAMAGFSAGTIFIQAFLGRSGNLRNAFCLNVLKEVYFFEPTRGILGVPQATSWARTGEDDKVVRLYTASPAPGARTLLRQADPGDPTESSDGRRSAIVLGMDVWRRAVAAAADGDGGEGTELSRLVDGQAVHQLISATMLGHAIRRSGFG